MTQAGRPLAKERERKEREEREPGKEEVRDEEKEPEKGTGASATDRGSTGTVAQSRAGRE